MKKERKMYSLGCANCNDLAIGRTDEGIEFIPIFRTKELADLEFSSSPSHPEHPMKVIEINVQIL